MKINVSKNKINFSQRNNERDPLNVCNVTSMVMAASYLGYKFPEGKYKQPEDNLHLFMTEKGLRPWVHDELSKGTNLWMGKNITNFSVTLSITAIFEELKNEKPVVMSGNFPGHPVKLAKPLGHIVVLVGAEWQDGRDNEDPKTVIIDDPYGNTMDNWKGSGNDIVIPWETFIAWMKPCGDNYVKWGHFFKKPEEV